ncbi:MAG TPA: hypothetical protein VHO47_00820 [Candidatus Babeliales bacterium]|nr:hypothetical protein [Candidatus Babeliales bacterium]
MKKIVFVWVIIYSISSYGKIEEVHQLPHGNYALPTSQQPGPLFSFGQNIVDKKDVQAYLFVDYFRGKNICIDQYTPSIFYGISDNSTILLALPAFSKLKNGLQQATGAGDFFAQIEYAYYKRDSLYDGSQSTIVASLTFPTGSIKKQPPTGLGATSFFLGATASYMDFDWYYFASLGATLPTSPSPFKNIYFYQLGVSRNIYYKTNQWILNALLEIDGIYTDHQLGVNGATAKNSGGHTLFIGPSIWFSTQRLIIQAGFSFPLAQVLFGDQNKIDFQFSVNIGWKFNSSPDEKNDDAENGDD